MTAVRLPFAGLTPMAQLMTNGRMRALSIMILIALATAGCQRESEVTGSTDACPVRLYGTFDGKDMHQCVKACMSCDRGTIVTCSTSCTLKGAR
jgi:ferredoxin-like protein FixX